MDFNNIIVMAHRGFFDAASRRRYRENSREVCELANAQDYITMIELDIRKSADGVLYCYHGKPFFYHILSKFRRPLSHIQQRYGVNTLEEILAVISADKIVFLDFKHMDITRDDVLKVFNGRTFREVILANKSVKFLRRFHSMPQGFVKVINGNVLSSFYNLDKLKAQGYKYFETLFPFQINSRIVRKVRAHGLEFMCASNWFLSRRQYLRALRRYDIHYFSSDFIQHLPEYPTACLRR
ncbi:glycerophosphodiester phosphodiesterase [Candidatus Falkowbacteria bacterium]|nr:glycerophosphodiester phosphodiesterase [Candidatus Falkowbacteria bacterium]